MLLCGSINAAVENVDFTTLEITKTDDGFTLESGNYAFTAVKNNGQTAPTQNGSSKDIRLYAKNTITVNSTNAMQKMVFTISKQGLKRQAEITPSVGTMTYDMDNSQVTWTADAPVAVVDFTVGDKAVYGSEGAGKAGQFDFNSVEITTDEGGAVVEAPAFSVPGGIYTTPQTVTLTAAAGCTIHYTIDGIENAETVDAGLIHEWVSLGDDEGIAFDEDAMREWLAGIGKEYDTVGTTRTLERADGSGTYQVSGGTYGWITDEGAELENLKTYILSGEEQSVEFATKQKAKGPKGTNEIGDTYVEIDLGRQQLYYVKNGNIELQCNIISGNPNKGNDTPTGIYSFNAKERNQVLRGPKDPETGEYEWESTVDLWMPFIGNSVGCHDASWQSWGSWYSGAYKTVGSHGCVNLSHPSASQLYSLINVGDLVIVHN